jgi:hypothetical protein
MRESISIHSKDKTIYLPVGIYSVRVLGGWRVNIGDFSIKLTNLKTGKETLVKETFWKVQSFELNQRAKKVFTLDIQESTDYLIEFFNPKSLTVHRTNLFSGYIFGKPIPNKDLKVLIN